jgi:hypothetical protein
MCKCDVWCLIYLIYTRFLFVLINFIHFNLILILKFHKIIHAPLLGASFTRPKHSSSYSSNWNFYCSGLRVAFVHTPIVCYRFPCIWWWCLRGRYESLSVKLSGVEYQNICKRTGNVVFVVVLLLVFWHQKKKQDEMRKYMLFDSCLLNIIAGMCCNTQVGNMVI